MKKLTLAIAASLCLCASAFAADAPSYPASQVSSPVFDWTGFYVGAHVGGGWGEFQDVGNPDASAQDTDGVFGGFQIGSNYQTNSGIVLGVEADVSIGDVGKEWGGATVNDPYYGEDKSVLSGTVRGRVGYAMGNFLPYVTGGLAWSQNEHTLGCDADRVAVTLGCQNKIGGTAFENEVDDTTLGFVVGAGAEYALSESWSVKAEYLYTDFGDENDVFIADPNYPLAGDRTFENHTHAVNVGVNYRF